MLTIKGRVTVTSFRPNAQRLGYYIAGLPRTRALLLSVATQVANTAQANLIAGGKPGNKVQYPVYQGHRWSAQPSAVARGVRVKDATEVFRLGAPSVRRAGYTRVALVVADHPYSWPYEFGALGIRARGFLRAAVRKTANSHSFISLRRYRRPTP
jgi:hypothetical protein